MHFVDEWPEIANGARQEEFGPQHAEAGDGIVNLRLS